MHFYSKESRHTSSLVDRSLLVHHLSLADRCYWLALQAKPFLGLAPSLQSMQNAYPADNRGASPSSRALFAPWLVFVLHYLFYIAYNIFYDTLYMFLNYVYTLFFC